MVWDVGTYALIEGNYWKGELHFHLQQQEIERGVASQKDRESNGRENR
jgi:hypothetical protein